MNVWRPSRSVNPTRNFPNAARSSKDPLSGCAVGASLPAGAIAAPVHRAVIGQAAQALRHHRALHRVGDGIEGLPRDQVDQDAGKRPGVVEHRRVRVAQIPGQAVEVAEHVAARTGRVAVARRERCVVEEPAAGHHARRLGVVRLHVRGLGPRGRVDDRDRVVEPRQHVELASILVEDDAGGAAAADVDVARGARHERVVLELRRGEDTPTLLEPRAAT